MVHVYKHLLDKLLTLLKGTFFLSFFNPHFNIYVHIICHSHITVVTKYIIIHTKEKELLQQGYFLLCVCKLPFLLSSVGFKTVSKSPPIITGWLQLSDTNVLRILNGALSSLFGPCIFNSVIVLLFTLIVNEIILPSITVDCLTMSILQSGCISIATPSLFDNVNITIGMYKYSNPFTI